MFSSYYNNYKIVFIDVNSIYNKLMYISGLYYYIILKHKSNYILAIRGRSMLILERVSYK